MLRFGAQKIKYPRPGILAASITTSLTWCPHSSVGCSAITTASDCHTSSPQPSTLLNQTICVDTRSGATRVACTHTISHIFSAIHGRREHAAFAADSGSVGGNAGSPIACAVLAPARSTIACAHAVVVQISVISVGQVASGACCGIPESSSGTTHKHHQVNTKV